MSQLSKLSHSPISEQQQQVTVQNRYYSQKSSIQYQGILRILLVLIFVFCFAYYFYSPSTNQKQHQAINKYLQRVLSQSHLNDIIDYGVTCQFYQYLMHNKVYQISCFKSQEYLPNKRQRQCALNLQMNIQDQNDSFLSKSCELLAQKTSSYIIMRWIDKQDQQLNKKIGNKLQECLSRYGFQIDMVQTKLFRQQLSQWESNNIINFKKTKTKSNSQTDQQKYKQNQPKQSQIKQSSPKQNQLKQSSPKQNEHSTKLSDNLPQNKETKNLSSQNQRDQQQLKRNQKDQEPSKKPENIKFYTAENGAYQGTQLQGKYSFSQLQLWVLQDLYQLKQVKTIADFGGGMCSYAQELAKLGYDIECYDGNKNIADVTKFGKVMDLTKPQDLSKQFDWVQSFQVGEHLPPELSHNYVDTITKHARYGLIMSWAKPSQTGIDHINQKSGKQVMQMIYQKGFMLNETLTIKYRRMSEKWFATNMLVFERKQTPQKNVNFDEIFERITKQGQKSQGITQRGTPIFQRKSVRFTVQITDRIQFETKKQSDSFLYLSFNNYPKQIVPSSAKCEQDQIQLQIFICVLNYNNGIPKKPIVGTIHYKYDQKRRNYSFNIQK